MSNHNRADDAQPAPIERVRLISYLALLPFFIGAVGCWVFPDAVEWLTQAFLWYSVAAFSFACGAVWGVVLLRDVSARMAHFIAAKVFMVVAWSALFLPPAYALGVLLACHMGLYQWERYTHLKYALGVDYLLLRQQTTLPAVACHMLALFNVMRLM